MSARRRRDVGGVNESESFPADETTADAVVSAAPTAPAVDPAVALFEPPHWVVEADCYVPHAGRLTKLTKGTALDEDRFGAGTIRNWIAGKAPLRRMTVAEFFAQ